jgi:polyhydroxyalkanoate synthase
LLVSDHMLKGVDQLSGLDPKQRDKLRFATRTLTDALSPSNFALTNPLVLQKTFETKGQNLLKGLDHLMADLKRGQLTHTDSTAFEVGRNIAMTPGKVIHETPLYQLIQYTPPPRRFRKPRSSSSALDQPLLHPRPEPEKSFIRWAVEQGLTVFMVSVEVGGREPRRDDHGRLYPARRDRRGRHDPRPARRAGRPHHRLLRGRTALAAGLGLLAERGEAGKIASATFFTAQVDFEHAGDLTLFIDGDQMELIQTLSKDTGYLDGRYMAATFNLLRGRDLIWNYVTNNYLLGQDYPAPSTCSTGTATPPTCRSSGTAPISRTSTATTSSPSPAPIVVEDTPIDLAKVQTPAYIQAGREDHIAPPQSVWKTEAAPERPDPLRARRARATSPAWSIRRRPANISIGSTRTRRSRR